MLDNLPKLNGIVTLTTDFGLEDGYVGAMKGVIISYCQEAKLIDITHYIKPQSLLHGAYVLRTVVDYYPVGTLHLVVIDPTVGSSRKPVLLVSDKYYFIGPDNGLLYWVIKEVGEYKIGFEIKPQFLDAKEISSTFHGRDLFAPAVGLLLKTKDPLKIGVPLQTTPQLLNFPEPVFEDDHIKGEIIVIDHFGNAITNINKKEFHSRYGRNSVIKELILLESNRKIQKTVNFYSQLDYGEEGILWNSEDYLEIVLREDSFAKKYNVKIGQKVIIRL